MTASVLLFAYFKKNYAKAFTALVKRETFLAAVFLWKIPLEVALEISAIATGKAS